MADDYSTPLSPDEQTQYQAWAKSIGKKPEMEEQDYDLPGFYKWLQANPQFSDPSGRGHMTDQFKKPTHPTFSDQSQYHGMNGEFGGSWSTTPDGKDLFTPGPSNLNYWGATGLQKCFDQYEPQNRLAIPDGY